MIRRIGRPTEDATLGDVADYGSAALTLPMGGWSAAAERARQNASQGNSCNVYVGGKDVLPGCHETKTIAPLMSSWEIDRYMLGKQPRFHSVLTEHIVSGRAQQGYLSEEACVACDEDTNESHVNLLVKDSSTVINDKLSYKDQRVVDGAHRKEVQDLLDLKAYRIMSLEESRGFREENKDYILPSRWVDRALMTGS